MSNNSQKVIERAMEIIESACNNEQMISDIIKQYDWPTVKPVFFEEAAYRFACIYFTRFEEPTVIEVKSNRFMIKLYGVSLKYM
jgi:hypothetical protein